VKVLPAAAATDRLRFAEAIRIEPKSVLEYHLPASPRGAWHLRALLAPAPGSKGDTRVRVSAAGTVAF
jgi:hypothetical protein